MTPHPTRRFKPTDDPVAHRWRTVFLAALLKWGAVRVYVDPITRQLVTRKPKPSGRDWRLPRGAVLVGQYKAPSPASAFLADVRATMASLAPCTP